MSLPVAEPAIRQILLAHAPTAALAKGGVHISHAPQDERRPRLIITLIAGDRPRIFDGGSGSKAGYEIITIQVTALAVDYKSARELAHQASLALDDYSGTVTAAGFSVKVDWIEANPPRSLGRAVLDGQDQPPAAVAFDLELMGSAA